MNVPLWGPKGEGYVALQFGLFALIGFGPRSLPGLPLWPQTVASPLRFAGSVLIVAGLVLAALGLYTLRTNLSALPHPKRGASLVERGVYGLVRHPIYGGLILAAVGWALVNSSSLMLLYALLLALFFELKTRREEAQLEQHFANYGAYRQRVRKFIPYIY